MFTQQILHFLRVMSSWRYMAAWIRRKRESRLDISLLQKLSLTAPRPMCLHLTYNGNKHELDKLICHPPTTLVRKSPSKLTATLTFKLSNPVSVFTYAS